MSKFDPSQTWIGKRYEALQNPVLNAQTLRNRQWTGRGLVAASLLLLVLVMLSGCATPQVPAAEVPVAVSCVEKRPENPGFMTDEEIKALDDYRAVVALRLDRAKAQKYVGELEDVVEVCARAPSVVTVPR